MTFPQLRKHRSGKNYYWIEDETHFIEIQWIEKTPMTFHLEAKTYFEKLRIQEMLLLEEPYLLADEMEFEVLKNG